jgi:ABC-2 type transport system permease protein
MNPFVFLALHSAANRTAARLRRLKRPRYLLFAAVGGGYFYFFVVRHWVTGVRMAARADVVQLPPDVVEAAAGLLLIAVAVLCWCLPAPPSALPFSEAEIQHLFPAPVTRRALVSWKMAGAIPGALLGALIFSLGAGPVLAHGRWSCFLAGLALVFVAVRLHVMGVRLARFRLEGAGVRWPVRTLIALTLLAAVLGLCVRESLSLAGPPPLERLGEPGSSVPWIGWARAFAAGWPLQAVTAPARWLIRPALAWRWSDFFMMLPGAVAILLLNVLWLARLRVDLTEGALEAAGEMQTARRARMERRAGAGRVRVTRPPFRLAPEGSPHVALLWKSLVRMTRQVGGMQTLAIITLAVLSPAIVLVASGEARRAPEMVGALCALMACLLLLIGPGIFRADFAGELRHIEMLRAFPIRGRTLVAGALWGPVAIMTLYQWLLLLGALLLAGRSVPAAVSPAALAFAVALVCPAANLSSSLVQNALVLLLPGWMTLGTSRPSGIESMGMGIVSTLARLLALSVFLLPAAVAFALCLLAGLAAGVPEAGLVTAGGAAAAVMAAEAALGIWWLGAFLDRLDPASELDAAGR